MPLQICAFRPLQIWPEASHSFIIIIVAEEAGHQQSNSPDKCKPAWIDSQRPWMQNLVSWTVWEPWDNGAGCWLTSVCVPYLLMCREELWVPAHVGNCVCCHSSCIGCYFCVIRITIVYLKVKHCLEFQRWHRIDDRSCVNLRPSCGNLPFYSNLTHYLECFLNKCIIQERYLIWIEI